MRTLLCLVLGVLAYTAMGACPEPSALKAKWDLWSAGSCLKGANVWQMVNFGDRTVGPEYTTADLEALARLGANYVHLSHPGIFTERPPYVIDERVAANLDALIATAEKANLFVVISFRTGPGRNEAGFDQNTKENALHALWTDREAQDSWAAMWKATAERYRDKKSVVGYDLLVEPNSNAVLLQLGDPSAFYSQHGGSLYDFRPLALKCTSAIRSVDNDTPILVSPMDYASLHWLPHFPPTGDPKTVYTIHHYEPYKFTHQDANDGFAYPGGFKNDEGYSEFVDQAWILAVLSKAADYGSGHHVPIAVTEWGVSRWAPGADRYIADMGAILDKLGMSHAVWLWEAASNDDHDYDKFNYRYGKNPRKHHEVVGEKDAVRDALATVWGKIPPVRPSMVTFPSR
jgi:hypothetical protein